jgi:uncharacterized protein
MRTSLSLLLFICLPTLIWSQEKINYINSKEFITENTKLAEEKQHEKIVENINKLNPNDSLYIPLQISKSYHLLQLKKYDDVISVTANGLKICEAYQKPSFRINQSIAYVELKEYQKALETIKLGIKEFPRNSKLYAQKGSVYKAMNKPKEAAEALFQAIILDPFEPLPHLKLGYLCYDQQLSAQALMCFSTYLILNPDGENSGSILAAVDTMFNNPYEKTKDSNIEISKDDSAFEDINLILDNRIANKSNYKVKNEINISYTKQNHILFEQLKKFKANGDFWDNKYVKLYQWIAESESFDNFIYTTTYSVPNPEFKKIVNKKEPKIIAFLQLFNEKWKTIMDENEIEFLGKKQVVNSYFVEKSLKGFGIKKNGKLNGYWEFHNNNGVINLKGLFNDNEKKNGIWESFHDNGIKSGTYTYSDGLLNGPSELFYENGQLKQQENYSADKLSDTYKKYDLNGGLLEKRTYTNDQLNGEYLTYYIASPELLENQTTFVNNSIENNHKRFSPEGILIFETNYKSGKADGVEKKFYISGKPFMEAEKSNDKFSGYVKKYYSNGQLSQEGNAFNNVKIGLWKNYHENGQLESETNYKNGLLEGTYTEYTFGGKKLLEHHFKNDKLVAYKFYNTNGNTTTEEKIKGGKLSYKGYSIDGALTSQGLYNMNGGKTGEWKYYNTNGILASTYTYDNDKIEGKSYKYYNDHLIRSITEYKNDEMDGYHVSYFDNEKIKEQGWYLEGEKDKEWHEYYKNGTLKAERFYHNGQLNGEQRLYAVDGKPSSTEIYKYGNLITEKIYNVEGKIAQEIYFDPLVTEKTVTTYYPNQQKQQIINYKNGIKHGLYTSYDFNGNMIVKGNYVNGQQSGKWEWYHTNKNLKKEASFINGEFDGMVKEYYENGNLEEVYNCILGDVHGKWITYAQDGKTIIDEINYVLGKIDGKRIFYNTDGQIQHIRFYEYDRIIGHSHLDKNGQELPMIEIKNETAKIISYYSNGQKSREMEIVNGLFENKYTIYYPNGKILRDSGYKNDRNEGIEYKYYSDGKIKEESNYSYGELNGITKKYHENGQLKEVSEYLNNEKNGSSKYYNTLGKLIKEEKYFDNEPYEIKIY